MNFKAVLLISAVLISVGFKAKSQDNQPSKSVYFFDVNHLNSSMRHEFGFSFLTHFAKSPLKAEYNLVSSGVSYPQPVFNRVYSIFSMGYEPQLRLVEVGSNFSLSFDVPFTLGLSTVDLRTPSSISYSTEPITDNDINTGIFSKERTSNLGALNGEVGALLSFNFFQGATIENTKAVGFSFAGGINHITAPLVMNIFEEYERSEYKGLLSWTSVVGRFGLRFGRMTFYYTMGINPTRVIYFSSLGNEQRVFGNTYNRFSFSFRLGK